MFLTTCASLALMLNPSSSEVQSATVLYISERVSALLTDKQKSGTTCLHANARTHTHTHARTRMSMRGHVRSDLKEQAVWEVNLRSREHAIDQ